MPVSAISEIEKALQKQAQQVAERYRPMLAKAGLSLGGPEIEIWNAEDEARTSELRIWISRDGDVVDIIEFHLVRAGRQVLIESEMTTWLDEQFSELVARASR